MGEVTWIKSQCIYSFSFFIFYYPQIIIYGNRVELMCSHTVLVPSIFNLSNGFSFLQNKHSRHFSLIFYFGIFFIQEITEVFFPSLSLFTLVLPTYYLRSEILSIPITWLSKKQSDFFSYLLSFTPCIPWHDGWLVFLIALNQLSGSTFIFPLFLIHSSIFGSSFSMIVYTLSCPGHQEMWSFEIVAFCLPSSSNSSSSASPIFPWCRKTDLECHSDFLFQFLVWFFCTLLENIFSQIEWNHPSFLVSFFKKCLVINLHFFVPVVTQKLLWQKSSSFSSAHLGKSFHMLQKIKIPCPSHLISFIPLMAVSTLLFCPSIGHAQSPFPHLFS